MSNNNMLFKQLARQGNLADVPVFHHQASSDVSSASSCRMLRRENQHTVVPGKSLKDELSRRSKIEAARSLLLKGYPFRKDTSARCTGKTTSTDAARNTVESAHALLSRETSSNMIFDRHARAYDKKGDKASMLVNSLIAASARTSSHRGVTSVSSVRLSQHCDEVNSVKNLVSENVSRQWDSCLGKNDVLGEDVTNAVQTIRREAKKPASLPVGTERMLGVALHVKDATNYCPQNCFRSAEELWNLEDTAHQSVEIENFEVQALRFSLPGDKEACSTQLAASKQLGKPTEVRASMVDAMSDFDLDANC